VIGTCLPKISCSSGPGLLVDVPGKAQVPGLVAVGLPADGAPDPRLGGDGLDLGNDVVFAAAGLAAGQRGRRGPCPWPPHWWRTAPLGNASESSDDGTLKTWLGSFLTRHSS
jgi:hypothetical protein